MAKGLKKEINFAKVRKLLIDGRVDKLHKHAGDIESRIVDRTTNGKDVNLSDFKPYSKEYAKRKGQSNVDLQVSGRMLKAITHDKESWGLHFRFSTNRENSKAAWNQKLRKFFGVDKRMLSWIKKQIKKI